MALRHIGFVVSKRCQSSLAVVCNDSEGILHIIGHWKCWCYRGVPYIAAIKLRRSTEKRPLECVGNIPLQCIFEGMHGTRIFGAYECSIFTGVVAEQLRDIFDKDPSWCEGFSSATAGCGVLLVTQARVADRIYIETKCKNAREYSDLGAR